MWGSADPTRNIPFSRSPRTPLVDRPQPATYTPGRIYSFCGRRLDTALARSGPTSGRGGVGKAGRGHCDVGLAPGRYLCRLLCHHVRGVFPTDQGLEEDITEALEDAQVRRYHREGTSASGWVLLDFSNVLVHIFGPEEREFYALERLWSRAPQVVRVL